MGQDTEVNLRSPTREVYEELQRAYDHYNERLFGGQLPECVITLQRDNPRTYGYFSFKRFGNLKVPTPGSAAAMPRLKALKVKRLTRCYQHPANLAIINLIGD